MIKWNRVKVAKITRYEFEAGDVHGLIYRDALVGWGWEVWGDKTADSAYFIIESSNPLLIGAKAEAAVWALKIIEWRRKCQP